MIKLLFFIPCEKIIVDSSGVTSIVGILENVNLGGVLDQAMPENAGMPMSWSAVALWNRPRSIDDDVQYEARVELIAPNGQVALGAILQFAVSNEFTNFRNTFNFPVIPVGQAGFHNLILSYKRQDSEEWQIAAEYPINVIHELDRTLGREDTNQESSH